MDSYCGVSDDELAEEALAAGDPDQAIPTDAVPLRGPTGQPATDGDLLPGWYMPAPLGSSTRRSHRILAYAFVGSLIAVNLSGLCVTYGHLVLA